MAERFKRQVNARTGVVNPQAGLEHRILADTLSQFSRSQAAQSAQAGIEDAGIEGFNAGVAGEDREASELTAAGRAFNDAARLGHLANVRRDIKTRIGELAIAAQQLPPEQWVEAFETTTEGFREGLLDEMPDELKGEAQNYFADTAGTTALKLLENQTNVLKAETLKDVALGQQQLTDDINTAARELNQGLLTVRQREFEALINTVVETGDMSEAEGAVRIQEMHSQAVQNEILGAFDAVIDSEGAAGAAKSLERFKKGSPGSFGLSADEKDVVETTMTALWNRERAFEAAVAAKSDATNKAALAVMNQEADDAIAVLNQGNMPATDISRLYRDLVAAEKFDKVVDLKNAIDLQTTMAPLQSATPAQKRSVLAELDAKGTLTGDELRLQRALEGAVSKETRLLENNPRELARQQDLVDDDELNFESVEALTATLAARVPGARDATEHYGSKVPPITTEEADAIGRFWQLAEPETQLAIAQGLHQALGPDAGDVLELIGDKEYSTTAYAGGLVSIGQNSTASAILRGQKLLGTQDVKGLIPEGVEKQLLTGHINARLGNAFQLLPGTRQTAIDASLAWYADRAAADGDFSGEWNQKRADAAIRATIGNMVEDNTGGTVPLRNGDQEQFDTWLGTIDDAMIAAAGGANGIPASRIRDARFIAVAEGAFNVVFPSPFDALPKVVLNDKGKPLRLVFDPFAQGPERRGIQTTPSAL